MIPELFATESYGVLNAGRYSAFPGPVFFPMIMKLGYDPIWFGVIIVIFLEMGAITPPVSVDANVIKGVAADVELEVMFKGIFPFFLTMVACIIILFLFSQIALFLPSLR